MGLAGSTVSAGSGHSPLPSNCCSCSGEAAGSTSLFPVGEGIDIKNYIDNRNMSHRQLFIQVDDYITTHQCFPFETAFCRTLLAG